jgi:hypothetical protein
MRLCLLVVLGLLVFSPGCSRNDEAAKKLLEQQKINLEQQKRNEDTLAMISEKENEIAAREKDIREALKSIEAQKKELLKKEAEVKKLIEEEKKLSAQMKESNENADKYSQLVQKRTSFLDDMAADWAKAALSAPHMPGNLDAELEKELDSAISENKSNSDVRAIYEKYYNMARTLWHNNIQLYLQQNDVIHIKPDEEFENTARQLAEKFVKTNTTADDFEIIEKAYLKLQADKDKSAN